MTNKERFVTEQVGGGTLTTNRMKASLVVLHVIACAFFLVGIGMLQSATSLPVYTDPGAPEALSRTLEDLPRDQRFKKWYQELPKFETAHKRLTDQGRGLMALGIGISCGALFLQLLKKSGENRGGLLIGVYWTLLWAVKFPLTLWYYSVRQSRFDYPVWGDSIAIGIFQDCIAWVLGFFVFTILLLVLMRQHKFPPAISLCSPHGPWEWTRTVVLWLWILLLLACILPAVGDGDEGMVLSCTGAVPLILLALSAIPQPYDKTSLLPPDQLVGPSCGDSSTDMEQDLTTHDHPAMTRRQD